jgi:lipopolysaccharide/colanic/teichoic acid biosynthesis glycosyltransferase
MRIICMRSETSEFERPAAGIRARAMRTLRYEAVKPVLDFALAALILVLSLPVLVVAAVMVKLTSRGPAIYTQARLGLGGKVFTIYKIRTMYLDSEQHCGPRWSAPGDPRVTAVGRVFRWCHVDELPQLVNILAGQMSLIGPRPERPEFLNQLERALPDYRRRLTVRPGLTGLAQVQQPPDTDISSVRRKLNYDLYYVQSINLWLDFRVMLATVLKCLGVSFVWIGRILQLPDPNPCATHKSSRPEPELATSALVSDLFGG